LWEWSLEDPLVVVLRADHLGSVAEHAELARCVERGLVLVGSPDEHELRAIISCPAEQAGLLLEPGLVDLLIRDVVGEPGGLPLLSHALRSTWERREGRVLTVAGYTATGGIHGAVAQSAEALHAGADEDEQRLIRQLMLRLVVVGPNGEPERSRIPRAAVAADRRHELVLERLVGAWARVWSRVRTTGSSSPTRRSLGRGRDCGRGWTRTSTGNASAAI
jgi:hypothetical protein